MKPCIKCKEIKPLSSFYEHKMMADGHLNKCKICTKKDVKKNRDKNIDYYRKYDCERSKRYLRKKSTLEYQKRYSLENKNKKQAHWTVYRALKKGIIVKDLCEFCGKKYVHGHHDDYSQPLKVRWLCPAHHKLVHKLQDNILKA